MRSLADLPVNGVLPDVAEALGQNRPVVLQAPPGTGKTLLTAPYLLNEPWLAGRKIILLEPRRLAARAAACRMASLLGEEVGGRVGYQVRLERVISPNTRIEVLTEGLLAQRLLSDPELGGVGLVIFDEFHERNLAADFSLALTLDAKRALRGDLRLIVMSATLNCCAMAEYLGTETAVVTAHAQSWPVATSYLARSSTASVAQSVAYAVASALAEDEGGILAFLPGEGEIRRTEELLRSMDLPCNVDLCPLYGALPRQLQDRAVGAAAYGRRKVVLATSIAESSLTIQDISIVIDSGWMRVPRFSPRNGMSRLETLRITRDRADQRRGRAGRQGPGKCYRLWDMATDAGLLAESSPEILDADLASLRLQAADWGVHGRLDLPWVTPPPDSSWQMAEELLRSLGSLDGEGRITARGRRLAALPVHPRLAHAIERAADVGAARQGALVAAIVEEATSSSELRGEADLRHIMECFEGTGTTLSVQWKDRVQRLAKQWGRRYPVTDKAQLDVGRILSWAFPDRIAKRRAEVGHFHMVNGRGVVIGLESGLSDAAWIVAADVQDLGGEPRVRLAASVEAEDVMEDFAEAVIDEESVSWDRRLERVTAVRRRRIGSLVLGESGVQSPDVEAVATALLSGVRQKGIANLGWDNASRNLQARIMFLRRVTDEKTWPDVSDEALAASLEDWLAPWIGGMTRWEELKRLSLTVPIEAMIAGRRRDLDRLAPTHWTLPGGSRAKIRYDAGEAPVAMVILQQILGVTQTPRLAEGKAAVRVEILSPARRVIAVTDDLAGFWQTGYPLVRKDMRGRYPKHSWPEDPLTK